MKRAIAAIGIAWGIASAPAIADTTKLDIPKLDQRYQELNKDAERTRLRSLPGIAPNNVDAAA